MHGMTRNNIARVTTTGWLDMTFDPNASSSVGAIVFDRFSNSIIVAG